MNFAVQEYSISNLTKINVVLGKNGCGKSSLLKAIDNHLTDEQIGRKRYVTPERGGVLTYDANVETNILSNPVWMSDTRRVNQYAQFKQQSAAQFKRLETLVFREAEGTEIANFQPYVDRLNTLLDNIELRRVDPTFKIYDKKTGGEITPQQISSGESELISLGIELLMFSKEKEAGKTNLLILDEPDVHLHPDLQERMTMFLCSLVDEGDLSVIMATHSTAVLGSLADYSGAAVAFMQPGDKAVIFDPITAVHRRVLPVFGAHPLSNVFNKAPVLIVEGEDDERIWQQAVRTSEGRVKVYPVPCDGVSDIGSYETEVGRIVACVYDNGIAFSLRDGDGFTEELDDIGVIRRFRLKCRAAENLMLTDEVLLMVGIMPADIETRTDDWLAANSNHPRYAKMLAFKAADFDRKNFDLKEIRMILAGQILATNKPWEVLVGQALGQYKPANAGEPVADGTIADFLGTKVVDSIFR